MKKTIFTLAFFAFWFIACDDEGSTIALPDAVQTYLDANYPGAEVEESEQGKLCDGTDVYEVELEVADDEELDLVFSVSEEVLLFTETEIATSELPAAVTASIGTNYAEHSIEEAERLDLAGGSTQYEVELKNGATTLEVAFGAGGEVVCEAVDEED